MFGKHDGLTFEDEDIEAKEVETTDVADTDVDDAAEPVDAAEVDTDEVAADDAEDEVIEDDTDGVEVDDAAEEDECCGDELETTMNPAADEVEVSEDGYATDEDDELLDAEPSVTAPTSFNPNEVPESNIQA